MGFVTDFCSLGILSFCIRAEDKPHFSNVRKIFITEKIITENCDWLIIR